MSAILVEPDHYQAMLYVMEAANDLLMTLNRSRLDEDEKDAALELEWAVRAVVELPHPDRRAS